MKGFSVLFVLNKVSKNVLMHQSETRWAHDEAGTATRNILWLNIISNKNRFKASGGKI